MEQRSRPFRILVGPPVVAMGLALALAYWLRGDAAPAPAASPAQLSAPSEPRPPETAGPSTAEPKRVPPPAPPRAPSPAQAAAPAAATPQDSGAPWPAQFANPEVRAHANLMITEAARKALKERNLDYLQGVRAAMRDAGIDAVLPANDLLAIDVGIDCLAEAQDARQRALDFIEDNPASILLEGVREACR